MIAYLADLHSLILANQQEEKVMSETKEFKNGNGEKTRKRKPGNNRTGRRKCRRLRVLYIQQAEMFK